MKVKNENELGKALKDGENTIEIEGDLAKKVIRIKATGNVAWLVALGAIAVAIGIAIGSGGTGAPVSGAVAVGSFSILGFAATVAAIAIANAAGGIGVLNKLRKYNLTINGDLVILTK